MRRRALVVGIALALGVGAAVTASCGHGTEPSGGLTVEPNPVEFGAQRYGERIDKKVTIVNRSSGPVTFADPTFDCSCFMLLSPPAKNRLEAGESLDVTIRMDTTKAYPGRFVKTMTLHGKSPARRDVDVHVTGEVLDFREIQPRQVAFGAVASDAAPVEKRVSVRGGKGGSHVEVTHAVGADPSRVAVSVERGKEGADVVLRTVKGAPKGRFDFQVLLDLSVRQGDAGEPHAYTETVWVTGEVK
jgi:hypothetical protein